jgi:hypothetical protein
MRNGNQTKDKLMILFPFGYTTAADTLDFQSREEPPTACTSV